MGSTAVLTDSAIEVLFKTFARRWAHRWEKTFADGAARDVWRTDLLALGVNDTLLKVGLFQSARLAWPPSPAEFAALCWPDDLPDVDTAYRRACVSHWSPAVVYEAARRVGTFELGNWPESRSRPLFERVYAAVCAEWLAGQRFKVPKRAALPVHKPKKASAETARAEIEKIRRLLGMSLFLRGDKGEL